MEDRPLHVEIGVRHTDRGSWGRTTLSRVPCVGEVVFDETGEASEVIRVFHLIGGDSQSPVAIIETKRGVMPKIDDGIIDA